jgi:hypothetical protein
VAVVTDLLGLVRETCGGLADKRRGRNTRLSMADIGMAAFSVFFMQSPSFLAHQRQLCEGVGQGRCNCETLLGMTSVPSDNHIRDSSILLSPPASMRCLTRHWLPVEQAGAPEAMRGTGAAAALGFFMVKDARRIGLRILPLCPYVRAQYRKHPDWTDVMTLAPGEDPYRAALRPA